MRFLVLMRDASGVTSSDFDSHREPEKQQVYKLIEKGIISEIYFRDDRDDAVLLLECKNRDKAKEYLSTLPMIEAGLLEYELIGLLDYPSRS